MEHRFLEIGNRMTKRKATNNTNNNTNNNNMTNKRKRNKKNASALDPSQRYIRDPKSCPAVKSAKTYFQSLSLPIRYPVHLYHTSHWRTVCKLPVRSNMNNKLLPDIGLFLPGSHTVLSVSSESSSYNDLYPAHHPSINKTIQKVREACGACKCAIPAYNEKSGAGLLRYIAINVERETSKVQLTLVWNSKPPNHKCTNNHHPTYENNNNSNNDSEELLLALKDKLIQMQDSTTNKNDNHNEGLFVLHSLWVHYNAAWKHDNAIFSRSSNDNADTVTSDSQSNWRLLYGTTYLTETLQLQDSKNNDKYKKNKCEKNKKRAVVLHFAPNVFRQANLDAFQYIVGSIVRELQIHCSSFLNTASSSIGNKKCVELYGGVGTIGFHVAHLFDTFLSSDENPYNVPCFQRTLSTMIQSKPHFQQKRTSVTYIPKNARDMVLTTSHLRDAQVVIVDPPRKGLEEEVVQALVDTRNNTKLSLLVYVSCGFDAFRRDCAKLLQSKCWKLRKAEGHILFPGADHIETLAFFERIQYEIANNHHDGTIHNTKNHYHTTTSTNIAKRKNKKRRY